MRPNTFEFGMVWLGWYRFVEFLVEFCKHNLDEVTMHPWMKIGQKTFMSLAGFGFVDFICCCRMFDFIRGKLLSQRQLDSNLQPQQNLLVLLYLG